MQNLKTKLATHWSQLSPREQQSLLLGTAFLILVILYVSIWSPLTTHVTTMRKQLGTQQKTLRFMEADDQQIQQASKTTKHVNNPTSPIALLSDLQKRIDNAGLTSTLNQLKQTSNDTIEMHFTKVEYDKLMRLLIDLLQEQAITIPQLTAVDDPSPGLANVDILIKF